MKRPMFALRSLPLLLLATGCLVDGEEYVPPTDPNEGEGYQLKDPVDVLYVIDGDTIAVLLDEVEETVRFEGVDTPERHVVCSYDGQCPTGQDCQWRDDHDNKECGFVGNDEPKPEACYAAAKQFTQNAVTNQVDLAFDSICQPNPLVACRDMYGRLLAYVTLANGLDLGRLLISKGYAKAFIFAGEHFDREAEYLAVEAEAENAGLGIWGTGCP